jgi:hypothetical protein
MEEPVSIHGEKEATELIVGKESSKKVSDGSFHC